LPSVYKCKLPLTRDPKNFQRISHPLYGICQGLPFTSYRAVPSEIAGYMVGTLKPFLLKQRNDGSPRITACLDKKIYRLSTDQRLLLRPAIKQGRILLLKVFKGGAEAGLVLAYAPKKIRTIKNKETLEQLHRRTGLEIIDYANQETLEAAREKATVMLDQFFPNAVNFEMWGTKRPAHEGGALLKVGGQQLGLGTFKKSPYHSEDGANQVLFSANPVTGEAAVGVVEKDNGVASVEHLGTILISTVSVSSNGLSLTRNGGLVTFETLCERAALTYFISPKTLAEVRTGTMNFSFAQPPYSDMLDKGQLSCRSWLGGTGVDWKKGRQARAYFLPLAADGTVLDGLGRPVRHNGGGLNVRTDDTGELPFLNFWTLYEARIPQGLANKHLSGAGLIKDGLEKLMSRQELGPVHFKGYVNIELDQNGNHFFEIGNKKIPLTSGILRQHFKNGGKIYLAFEPIKDGVMLAAYHGSTREFLTWFEFDAKQAAFWYQGKNRSRNQRTYLLKLDPDKPNSLFGIKFYPNEKALQREDDVLAIDLELTPQDKLRAITGVKKPLRSVGSFKPILDDTGKATAFIISTDIPARFLAEYQGWLPISKWRFERSTLIEFNWGRSTKNVGKSQLSGLGISAGEDLWVKAENGYITAVGVMRKGKINNIQPSKVVRDETGTIIFSSSKNLHAAAIEEGHIFSGMRTQKKQGCEVVAMGGGKLEIRPLEKGEKLIPRSISFVKWSTDSGDQAVLVHNAASFEGIMLDIAVTAANIFGPKALTALQKATLMFETGATEREIADFLFSQDHPLLKERFYEKAIGGREWFKAQKKEAFVRLKLIRSLRRQFNLLMLNLRHCSVSLFVRETENILAELITLTEANAQSLMVRRQNILAYLTWRGIMMVLARSLYPTIIQSRSLDTSAEIIKGLRLVVDGQLALSTGDKEIDAELNIPERLEEISAFLASLKEAA